MSDSGRHPQMRGLSYKNAGVNIDAGNALVDMIKPVAKATARAGADGALGGFGAFFDLKQTQFRDPLLVASTDGVGTKVKIAVESNRLQGIGIDLVAMCVNDIVTSGAEPLFFLDYFATGHLDIEVAASIITSIAAGCEQAGCALIGGETAEMPGVYRGKDLDLAGFCVGAVERDQVITGATIAEGDILLGLASDGVHSNGFSLVRKVVEVAGLSYNQPAPFASGQSLAEALLIPTRIYVKSCLQAIACGGVRGLVHITGGGLIDNIPRVLPKGLAAEVDVRAWDRPAVFPWLQEQGNIADVEMLRTLNCGIGMVAIIQPDQLKAVIKAFEEAGETVFPIGKIVPHDAGRDYVHFLRM